MPNSKLKCKYCKEYYPREEIIQINSGRFCRETTGRKCIVNFALNRTNQKLAKAKIKKDEKKQHAKRKRKFYENDTKTRKAAAKAACHAYIKARDAGEACICCGRELKGQVHAGHYLESGNNPRIRYDEDNIHSQLAYCNTYQGGNSDDYRGRLVRKIGLERVERLESMKGGTIKRTPQDYKEIEIYYKQKLKQLKEIRNGK